MDSLPRSPVKLLREKCNRSLDIFSPVRTREVFLAKDRKLAALNLSIRKKKKSLRDSALQTTSFKLFNNEEIFSLAEKSMNAISNFQSPINFRKRKFCNIINEERENYESVDMTVDLCFSLSSPLTEDNSENEQSGKRVRRTNLSKSI